MPSNARRPSLSTYLQLSNTGKTESKGVERKSRKEGDIFFFPPRPKSAMLNAQRNRRERESEKKKVHVTYAPPSRPSHPRNHIQV
jgi:hypothetical protein